MLKYGYDSEKRKPRGDRKKGAGQSGQQGKEKKAKMNVSGKSVFKLREIIVRKPKS